MNAIMRGIDPRTGGDLSASVAATDAAGLDAACRAAAAAAEEWARLAPHRRAEVCFAIAAGLRAQSDSIVSIADAETALGAARLTGELERTCVQWELYAEAMRAGELWDITMDSADPDASPAPRPDLRRMNYAIGPVAVYAASNFPLAFSVAGTDTAAAMAVGCPVVAKAHEGHPGTTALVAGIVAQSLAETDAPTGVFGVVYGFEAGVGLVSHPVIKAAAFTGSQAGGRALCDAAAARPEPIPFYGELGSLNPVVVTRQAVAQRGEEIAAGYAASFTQGSGQFCTKPGLLLLPRDHGLETAIADAVRGAALHPLLHQRVHDGFAAAVATLSQHPEVTTLVAASIPDSPGFAVSGAGLFATTTAALLADRDVLLAECFGPASLLATYRDDAELDEVMAGLPGGLTGAVHIGGDRDPQGARILAGLAPRCGRVIVDQWPTGVAVTWAQQHGGPWPAATISTHTSVGQAAMRRFLRPVAYQNVPQSLLPEALWDGNPWGAPRRMNGVSQV